MPQEVTRSARPQTVGPGVAHKAERSLVAREASAQEASGLFEIHLEPGKSGFAVCFMTRFALNLEEMRNKFHSVYVLSIRFCFLSLKVAKATLVVCS
jgi:hypothetical protein